LPIFFGAIFFGAIFFGAIFFAATFTDSLSLIHFTGSPG
jgi:hypothetical protein